MCTRDTVPLPDTEAANSSVAANDPYKLAGTPSNGCLTASNTTAQLLTSEREDLSGLDRWRKYCLFACSCLLQFLLQLDIAAVAVSLPV